MTTFLLLNMFSYAMAFNQPLPWNTENVTDMGNMFLNASSFNQRILGEKDSKWAFIGSQYLGECNKLPTDLIQHISEFAFHSWNMKKVSDVQNMFGIRK